MKRIILIIVSLAWQFVPVGLYAQKVYMENGKAVLDLTVDAGMPAGAVTNIKRTWTGTASSSAVLANNAIDEYINETVYQKLEVAPHDMNSAGSIDATGTMGMIWANAFEGCRSASYNGTGWRLPTQRELILIYIFKQGLEDIIINDLNGTPFSTIMYWSATETAETASWYVRLKNGDTNSREKTLEYYARCVRDL